MDAYDVGDFNAVLYDSTAIYIKLYIQRVLPPSLTQLFWNFFFENCQRNINKKSCTQFSRGINRSVFFHFLY